MKKPIIGITLDLPVKSEQNKYAAFPWYALRKNYMDSVIKAGGVPICLPYDHENIHQVVNLIDGLIIPGGDCDLHPSLYEKEILSDKVVLNEERSKFEIELFEIIKHKNIPFLGICFGMQIMNVSFGGDLIQHIPDHIKSDINHTQPHPKDAPWHNINIEKNTMLYDFAEKADRVMVNSTHHQAVGRVGQGLIASAIASDGIIEAIEAPDYKFMMGIQWHPEYLTTDPLDLKLFKALVQAATT